MRRGAEPAGHVEHGRALGQHRQRPGTVPHSLALVTGATAARTALAEASRARVQPRLPVPVGAGPASYRPIAASLLWLARTGASWRALPAPFGPWQTVYHRSRRVVRGSHLAPDPGCPLPHS